MNGEFIMKQDLCRNRTVLRKVQLCLLEMYFGDSVRRTKTYLRIIMLLVPSDLIVRIQTEINILFRLLELLILQKLLRSVFYCSYVSSRFSLPTQNTVYKYSQRCEKYNKYVKACFLFEQQNLNNKKIRQNIQLFFYWICFFILCS